MRILIFDVECVLVDTRYPLKDAFENLGHRVDMFDWSYYFPRHVDASIYGKLKSRIFEKYYVDLINKHLISVVKKIRYDLILIVMGRYIYPDTIQYIKLHAGCIANWSSDDIFNSISSSEFARLSLPLYDIHFTPRPHLLAEFLRNGSNKVVPLGWYYRPGLIGVPKFSPNNDLSYPVSFVGSWSHYRENYLLEVMTFNTSIFGWGWDKKSSSHFDEYRNQIHPAVQMTSMHKIFYTSAININILTIENRDVTNLRNYEIPAAMGFQLAERSDELLNLFEENIEIVCFSDSEELFSKCNFYLKNEYLRSKIARAGHERLVHSGYSLEDRLSSILAHVKEFL